VKNPYSGRSFLQRGAERAATLVDKARVIASQVEGRSIVLVDDSMIKGNSMRANVKKFRDAGAREIHVRIAAPPYEYPCHMGMDTGDPDELIARNMTIEEMCEYLGVDSIAYITPDRVQQAADIQAAIRQRDLGKLCMACSTGEYPFDVSKVKEAPGNVVLGMPRFRRSEALPLAGN
jgi:amidophosphoribosyltransferase